MSHYLDPNEKLAIIAHRGGSLEAPENTLAAFENAFHQYEPMIFETDVHRTRDGEVVVHHDSTVDRTTNGHGAIQSLTYDEIAKLDAGHHFTTDGGKSFPFRGKKVRVPLLKELLQQFPKSRVSVEIKHADPHFEGEVVRIITEAEACDRVVLAAERHDILKRARAAAPQMCSGFSAREGYLTLLANFTGLDFLAPNTGAVLQIPATHGNLRIITPQFMQKVHGRGKKVHVWTIDTEKEMRELIGLGVDGIITDAPSLLLRVANSLGLLLSPV